MANEIVPFSQELAQQLFDSTEEFPVDFDRGWQWLEFSTKGNAKRSFEKAGFIEGIDFCSFIRNDKREIGATQTEVMRLTCDCFKMWGMMAGTEKGKEVRIYFLDCERRLKAILKRQAQEAAPTQPIYLPSITQFEKTVDLAERLVKLTGDLNPTMQQLIKDHVANILADTKQLRASEELWLGAVNFARWEFDFICPKKGEPRDSSLGKWIRFYYPQLSEKQEKRSCNETQQDVWVYPVHLVKDELYAAMKAFIDCETPSTRMKLDGAYKRK